MRVEKGGERKQQDMNEKRRGLAGCLAKKGRCECMNERTTGRAPYKEIRMKVLRNEERTASWC